jgi:hypothetical protein
MARCVLLTSKLPKIEELFYCAYLFIAISYGIYVIVKESSSNFEFKNLKKIYFFFKS